MLPAEFSRLQHFRLSGQIASSVESQLRPFQRNLSSERIAFFARRSLWVARP